MFIATEQERRKTAIYDVNVNRKYVNFVQAT